MAKRAIVTGATGFVASNLCRRLITDGWHVAIIVRKSSKLEVLNDFKDSLKIYVYEDQINDLIELFNNENADVVFHLASLFIAEHQSYQIDALVDSNIRFGLHILEAMRLSNTKLIINTGTSWQNYVGMDYDPVDLYAATKEAYEKLIQYYVNAEMVRCITLKLYDTYGENDQRPKLINQLKKYAQDGTIIKLSPGEQIINLVHIDDVVNAFILAYEYLSKKQEVIFETYYIRSNTSLSLKQLVDMFNRLSDREVNVEWGGRDYRKREVMTVNEVGPLIPNWNCMVDLENGLKCLI